MRLRTITISFPRKLSHRTVGLGLGCVQNIYARCHTSRCFDPAMAGLYYTGKPVSSFLKCSHLSFYEYCLNECFSAYITLSLVLSIYQFLQIINQSTNQSISQSLILAFAPFSITHIFLRRINPRLFKLSELK